MNTDPNISYTKYVTRHEYSIEDSVTLSHYDIPCTIQKVASHEENALFLTTEGNVYALGENREQQFGTSSDCKLPTRLPVTDVIDIGFRHRSFILRRDNVYLAVGKTPTTP